MQYKVPYLPALCPSDMHCKGVAHAAEENSKSISHLCRCMSTARRARSSWRRQQQQVTKGSSRPYWKCLGSQVILRSLRRCSDALACTGWAKDEVLMRPQPAPGGSSVALRVRHRKAWKQGAGSTEQKASIEGCLDLYAGIAYIEYSRDCHQ